MNSFGDSAMLRVCRAARAAVLLPARNMRDPQKLNALDRDDPADQRADSVRGDASWRWASRRSGRTYVYLVDVKRDNDRLRDENARLREANFAAARRRRPRTTGCGGCCSCAIRSRARC